MTWPTTSAHPYTAQAPCDGEAHHLKKGKALVDSAFTADRWRDRTPMRRGEVAHYRRHKFCLTSKRDELVAFRHDAARDHRKARAQRLRLAEIDPPGAAYLAGLRACESGGNYSTNSGNGFFGAYQFDLQTWGTVGGSGYPHHASPREQDKRAAMLWRSRGSSPWPVCG